jgi:hypothetical protein
VPGRGLFSAAILILLAVFVGAPPGGPGIAVVVSLGGIPIMALWIVALWQTTRPDLTSP